MGSDAYSIEYSNVLAGSLSVLVHSRYASARNKACATSPESGTRLLSDELSDYRVDDPYIQADLHRPSSRLALDVDDSPNVLRDEEASGDPRSDPHRRKGKWAGQPTAALSAELIADVQVWRAATQVDPSDLRPTEPVQLGRAARLFQQQLDKRLAATAADEDRRWRQLLAAEAPTATADPFLPELTERLSNLTRAGFDATRLVR